MSKRRLSGLARLAGRRWRRLTAAGLPAALTVGGVLPALVHEVPVGVAVKRPFLCQGWRGCDGRGYSSYNYAAHMWRSYWRMSPGNECTNYTAFVEATVYHVPRPRYLLGNGGQWAATAAAHGVPVNNRPSVGAVAEWDPGAPGMSGFGHVAVVEQVGPQDSYIVVSQQDMSGVADDYNWILIRPRNKANLWQDWPSHFIHFAIPVRADIGYFNQRTNIVSLRDSQTHGPVNFSGRMPVPAGVRALPLVGDWRGTGMADLGFYTPKYGMFHLLSARRTRRGLANVTVQFGPPGMIPLIGDWRGTGKDGIGYYDPKTGTFSLRQVLSAGPAYTTFKFGPPGMVPIVGDWTGGRADQVGFYNPRKGTFTLRIGFARGRVYRSFRFGPAHKIPVVGNWNVGARVGIGYYDPRSGTFFLRVALSKGTVSTVIRFGLPHMIPLTGDWFGQYPRAQYQRAQYRRG